MIFDYLHLDFGSKFKIVITYKKIYHSLLLNGSKIMFLASRNVTNFLKVISSSIDARNKEKNKLGVVKISLLFVLRNRLHDISFKTSRLSRQVTKDSKKELASSLVQDLIFDL